MTIQKIDLEEIHDNPYQSRHTYHNKDIDDLATSIEAHGLLQVPPARHKNGYVELACGSLRKRAFQKLAKKDPQKWSKMPLDIRDITDEEMAIFCLEENLKRRDITPMEVAQAVDKYLISFPEKTETELAEKLNMTQGNISNMRRVLRLPEQVLEKIDQGRINFTMGRELVIFQGLPDEKELMLETIRELSTEARPYGHPCTVDGIQKSIHERAKRHLRSLEKEVYSYYSYSHGPLFDTKEAGCLKCEHMLRTHPTKSQAAHWCTNKECWDQKQQEHKDKVAAEARAKMTEDVLRKVAEVETKRETAAEISQEIIEPESPSEAVLTEEELEVYGEAIVKDDQQRARIESAKHLPADYPCHGCLNVKLCDRTTVYAGEEGKLVCENCVTKETAAELEQKATIEIPEELRAAIEEKAGTRAQVLDLNELYLGHWNNDLKLGYARLSDLLDHIIDPEECVEQCTQGFHYAFDSKRSDGSVMYVCTDLKCLSRKKSAFTRAKNAEGQARKNAERKAIKEAIAQTTTLDRPRIKLILLAQMDGSHATRHYYGQTDGKNPETWLWDKLSAGTPAIGRLRGDLFKRIDKLSDEELAKLVVEFMFYYLTDKEDIGSYEIKTTEPLKWMGIGVNIGGGD